MKTYYLIAQYYPQDGETVEHPRCVFGPCTHIHPLPLANVDPYWCYKSRKAAENYAAKCSRGYSRYEVIQVPATAMTTTAY